MALSNQSHLVSYNGNGATTVFAVPYFLYNTDIVAIKISSSGTEEVLSETVHYTLSGAGSEGGGALTMLLPPLAGEKLVIYRAPAHTQNTNLVPNDSLPADAVEDQLDYLTMMVQRLSARLDKALRVSEWDNKLASALLPNPVANGYLKWNAAANALEYVATVQQSASPLSLTSAYTVLTSDENRTLLCDATAAPFAVNLPAASALPVGFRLTVLKLDRGANAVTVTASGTDNIGGVGPRVTITGAANNGSGLVRITTSEQRFINTGDRVFVSGVTGTTEANGYWTVTRVSLTQLDLQGSAFTNAYVSGGTADYVRKTVPLRVQDAYLSLVNEGTRWAVSGCSVDALRNRDVLIGNNKAYAGFGTQNNLAVPIDFFYDAAFLRAHLRSVLLTEVGDPPEIGMRRAGGTYPDGPLTPTGASETLGIVHFTGWADSTTDAFQSRSAQIYARASENTTNTAAGGELYFGVTPNGTASGTVDAARLSNSGMWNFGPVPLDNAQVSVYTDNISAGFWQANNAAYASDMFRFVATRAASTAFKFFRCDSSNGGDIEFYVDGAGNVASDGGTAMASPADYAEMVREWWDGNAAKEDRAGKSVVLVSRADPDKVLEPGDATSDSYIRLADSLSKVRPDSIIGVVSVNPAIKGGAEWGHWTGKYLKDVYGRYIYEQVETASWEVIHRHDQGVTKIPVSVVVKECSAPIPDDAKREMISRKVLNPEYDPTREYVSREQRPEWDFVGLLGRLPLHVGQPMHPRWIVVRELAPGLNEVLAR